MQFSVAAVAAAIAASSIVIGVDAFVPPSSRGGTLVTGRYAERKRIADDHGVSYRGGGWRLLSTVNGDEVAAIAAAIDGDDDEDDESTEVGETEAKESSAGNENEIEKEEEVEEFKLFLEPVPPASYSVASIPNSGPAGVGSVHTLTIHLGAPGHPDPIVIETGRIGRQAAAAVTLTRGESVLYATASRSNGVRDVDFLPLSVEHQERFSSAGATSGSFNKRDGRPAEHEILVCRLVDRPLRPLVAELKVKAVKAPVCGIPRPTSPGLDSDSANGRRRNVRARRPSVGSLHCRTGAR